MSRSDTNRLAKNPNYYVINFLSLITLGFYAPYIYSKFAAKLNIMSRLALDNNSEKVKFSANFMYGALVMLWLPLAITLVCIRFIASPSAAIIIPLLAVALLSGVSLMLYIAKVLQNIKTHILAIAMHYGRYDIARTFEHDVGFLPSKREKLIQTAFNKLVDEHNTRV